MVQVRPTTGAGPDYVVIFLFLAFARKRINGKSRGLAQCRSDLNHPPTAVGGICTFRTVSAVGGICCCCRSDLNNPPTSRGWYFRFFHSLCRGWDLLAWLVPDLISPDTVSCWNSSPAEESLHSAQPDTCPSDRERCHPPPRMSRQPLSSSP